MIEVKALCKEFTDKKRGVVKAVDQVSFAAKPGEIFGLLGPNGAGKTTTLRMLATVLQPTGGTAVIDGCDIVENPRGARQRIGFLSGDMGLYHRLTPRELLRFFGRLNDMPKDKLDSRIEELFTAFGIHEYGDTKVDALSTGMKQKAAIARTLIHDPPVCILDEPTYGLDVPAAKMVEQFIRRAREDGKCIIFSTHIMEEAEYLCDRIAVIHRGRLQAEGTMEELRELTGKDRLREVFLALLEWKEDEKSEGAAPGETKNSDTSEEPNGVTPEKNEDRDEEEKS